MKERSIEDLFSVVPEMSEELSKSSIIEKIEKRNIKPEMPKNKKDNSFAFIAAIFVVLLVGTLAINGGFSDKVSVATKQENIAQTTQKHDTGVPAVKPEPVISENLPEGIYTFERREQVEEYFREISVINGYFYYVTDDSAVDFEDGALKNEAAEESVTYPVADSATGSVNGSYTGTNTQNGADEGDIIKTDGRYLYIVSYVNTVSYVKIVDTRDMKVLAELSYDYADGYSLSGEIYIKDDRLIVLYNKLEYLKSGVYNGFVCYDYYGGDGETLADVYDISDRAKPEKLFTVSQSGSIVSTRMIGDVLYTITRYTEFPDAEGDDFYCVPEVNGSAVDCKSIIHFNEENTWTYTIITATDISDDKSESGSLSILTNSTGMYCSEDNLYLARNKYDGSGDKTLITKISLNGTEIKCEASGEVEGCYNDKYSFDEYEGRLRIVTTEYDYETFKNKCHLYILDENLEVVSGIDDITNGLNEEVKAVRFMGKTAYVVTFEQTDPLFVLDLSDVNNPLVKGKLFMPGYSTYLHPVRDGILLGIGYGGDENSEDQSKLKIALYDVSDMNNPKILDEFIINNGYTDVNYDAKALIHYTSKSIIGIPVTVHSYNGYGNPVKSFAIISYEGDKLESVSGFVHETESKYYYGGLFRGTCIGDYLYTVDTCAVIEHRLSDGEKLRECILVTEEELNHKINVEEYKGYTDSGFAVATTSAAYIPE